MVEISGIENDPPSAVPQSATSALQRRVLILLPRERGIGTTRLPRQNDEAVTRRTKSCLGRFKGPQAYSS